MTRTKLFVLLLLKHFMGQMVLLLLQCYLLLVNTQVQLLFIHRRLEGRERKRERDESRPLQKKNDGCRAQNYEKKNQIVKLFGLVKNVANFQ